MTIAQLINELNRQYEEREKGSLPLSELWERGHKCGWLECLEYVLMLLAQEEEQ